MSLWEKPMRLVRLVLLVAASSFFGGADGVEYNRFQNDRSTLSFVFKQMGVPVDGRFKRFSASIAFDPAKPGAGSAKLDLDLSSIDAGSKEADDEVAGKAWFHVKAFPNATFVSSVIRPLGGDRFELGGRLTIKGRSQDINTPVTFRQEGEQGVFDGTFVLKRLDFAIGDGIWSDVGTVANEVQIKFHIVVAAASARK